MLEPLVLLPLPGIMARVVWPAGTRQWLRVIAATVIGWLAAYLLLHEVVGMHDIHVLAPEALFPSTGVALAVLLAWSRMGRRRTTFGRRS